MSGGDASKTESAGPWTGEGSDGKTTDPRARPRHLAAADEARLLEIERAFVLDGEERPARGLAISGGGIRSAAFSTGVLQALVAAGELEHFDYLSTVSGGGYVGSSLTYFLHTGLPGQGGDSAGTTATDFPFGSRDPDSPHHELRNRVLNFVRQQASYLCPTPRLGILSAFGVVTRASFLALLVYFSLLCGVLGILRAAGYFAPRHFQQASLGLDVTLSPALLAPLGVVLLLAVLSVVYVFFIWIQKFPRFRPADDPSGYGARTRIQMGLGVVLGVLGFSSVFAGLDLLEDTLRAIPPGASALTTLVGSWLGFADRARERKAQSGSGNLRVVVAALLVVSGLLLAAFLGSARLFSLVPGHGFVVSLAILSFGLAFGWIGNENYLGLHRMYRDRLMELFMPDASSIERLAWAPAREADRLGLHRVCGVERGKVRRPYHLVNTNAVLVNAERARVRSRGGDSFVLSPLYVGSSTTGWVRADHYMNAERGGRGMTLPSAMSISGAAVNPNTGVGGRGMTKTALLSFVLSITNLRLGYWAPNPAFHRSREPNFVRPGLPSMFGLGHDGCGPILELTDGGHFENLGLYELVRRRVGFVLAIDAGEDGDFTFSDLANAVERIRVDFGARLDFDAEFGLGDVCPGTSEDKADLLAPSGRLAKRPFSLGKIRYADGNEARFVYLKSTLFAGLPVDVIGYHKERPTFPHQATTDQFFDEAQFEAYRELGYYAAWRYLEGRPDAPIPAQA